MFITVETMNLKSAVFLALFSLGQGVTARSAEQLPKPMISGLKSPASVAIGFNGRMFLSELGKREGRILEIKDGKSLPFAAGLDDPKGLAFWQKWLFVVDRRGVWRIDQTGKAEVVAALDAFPQPPVSLNDLAIDEKGVLYISDSGDAVFRIDLKGKVTVVADARRTPQLKNPGGLVLDGVSFLLVMNQGSGELLRIQIADGTASTVASGFEGGGGLAWDYFGQLFLASRKTGKVWGIPRPGQQPILVASGFQAPADFCLDATGHALLIPDLIGGTVTALPTTIPGWEVDSSPLALRPEVAFPNLKWTGWEGFTEDGKVFPLRPLFLTHAGDGSNRVFVPIQQGTIHVFANDPKPQTTRVFLDLSKKTLYLEKENEQGLLGLAFHPQFQKNGEFFVFYTLKEPKLTNVLSRFRVSKDDPDRADPTTEEELLRFSRPYWNHDGGTICFGPDGYLYVTTGDGGAANDPHQNGQNLQTLLAKVLRLDVDRRDPGKNYAIPPGNPFVGKADVLPEIWAYGLRNLWRMAFDRKTGRLWAGEVGQNLYEEIILIEKGGNYGWSQRESMHPFRPKGASPRPEWIEPIWEYHHDIGRSITGGGVYRGKRLPELEGCYVYADYISGRMWALRYDEAKKRVVANHPLERSKETIVSFGEDQQGEIYFMAPNVSGRSIYRFARTDNKTQ